MDHREGPHLQRTHALLALAVLTSISPVAAQLAPLGGEFQVNTYTTSYQFRPAVAMDRSGGFVVTWQSTGQDDGSAYGVFARRYDSTGLPAGAELQVNSYTTNNQSYPDVAMDSSGAFVVVWQSAGQDGSGAGVFAQRFDASGAPVGGEFQINSHTTGEQQTPAVKADSAGNFVVVWSGGGFQDGDGYGVFGQRYDSLGDPQGAEFQVNSYTTGNQWTPAVAMDPSGGFVIAWGGDSEDGSYSGVFGQRYDSLGDPQGGEFQINTYTTGSQLGPALMMDGAGAFVAAWVSYEQDGSGFGVFGQRFGSGGAPQGGEFQVNAYTTGFQSSPSLAPDAAGGFVVTWDSDGVDGFYPGVVGRRYDGSGAAQGGEILFNTYTTNSQFEPRVAVDRAGNFVVAWTSSGQDGSGWGVFGQRLCSDGDADALCDLEDVMVTSPSGGSTLDCSNPRFVRPTFTWEAGNYEKFRVFVGSDPGFGKGTRITSGDSLLKTSAWTPSGKKWRNACNKALAANPLAPVLFVRVFGVDADLPKSDPYRKTFSQTVQADVQP